MSDKVYPVPAQWKKRAYVDDAAYREMYAESVKTPDKFWAKQAKRLDWFKAPKKIKNSSFAFSTNSGECCPRRATAPMRWRTTPTYSGRGGISISTSGWGRPAGVTT